MSGERREGRREKVEKLDLKRHGASGGIAL